MSQKKVFRIALTKGTLLGGAFKFFAAKGFEFEDISSEQIADFDKSMLPNHKLILNAKTAKGEAVEILLVRGHDVPAYVEHGAVDLAVVGLDVIEDSKADIVKLKDLDYGHCRLCVAAKKSKYSSASALPSYARIATSFPSLTKEFFEKKDLDVEVIKLYGSVEIGPLTDLSDAIVDLVATGKTLKAHGLEVIDEILSCSAYLIANKSSFKQNKTYFLELAND